VGIEHGKREGRGVMTNDRPRVNRSGFVAVQQKKVVALIPDERLDEVSAATR
jgi:hypothetical protein